MPIQKEPTVENILEQKPAEVVEQVNHLEYARMVNAAIKNKKQPWEKALDQNAARKKKPTLQPQQEVLEKRKVATKKGRL